MTTEDRYCAARSLYQAGKLQEARGMLEGLSSEEMAPRLAVRVTCLLGTIYRQVGEVGGALEQFGAAENYLPLSEDLRPVMAGTVAFERGLALWQGRRLHDALAALDEALSAFLACDLRQYAYYALLWRSWLYADMERPDLAEAELLQARDLAQTTEDGLRAMLAEARIALARRDPAAGMELVGALRRSNPANVPADVLAIACAIAAESAAIRCDWDEAEALADLGVSACRECSDWRVLHVCATAARRVAELRVSR